jgi:hypothetical protein
LLLSLKTIVIAMETTVQLSKNTVQILKDLKKKMHAKSYDEVISRLVLKESGIPKSMFGSNPKLDPFTEEERFTDREYS